MHHVINNLTEEIFLLQLLVKESDFQLNSIEVPKESLFFPFAFPSNGKYHPLYFPAILVNKKLCSSAILYQTCGTYYQEKKFGGSQDGGGIGRGDHFLFYKYIERTTERGTKFTKQLLIASSGHQAPRKAAHCLRREVGQGY